jgi:small subunit ribosomal protein S16
MIRLARRGARKKPHYRIVVIEKERARNGRPVEVVGTYNPRTNPASVELKRDRVEYWVSKGAQMSRSNVGARRQVVRQVSGSGCCRLGRLKRFSTL